MKTLALEMLTLRLLLRRILFVCLVASSAQALSAQVGEVSGDVSGGARSNISNAEIIPGIQSLFTALVATEKSLSSNPSGNIAALPKSNGSPTETVKGSAAESTTTESTSAKESKGFGTIGMLGSAPAVKLGEVAAPGVVSSDEADSDMGSIAVKSNPAVGNLEVIEKSLKPLNDIGRLPLPIAQVSPSGQTSFIQNFGQNFRGVPDQMSDLGSKPSVTFGSSDAGNTESFIATKPKVASKNNKSSNEKDPKKDDQAKKDEKEQKEKELKENLEKSIDAFVGKTNPFDRDDLTAYRAARDTFFGSPESTEMVGELMKEDPRITERLGELFGSFSPKDKESGKEEAKRAYEDFLRNPQGAVRGRIESEPVSPVTRPHIVDRPERLFGGPRALDLEQSPHQDN